jgi:heme A synthase
MTVETFLMLLTVCSVATGLVTEAVKKFLTSINVKYVSNVVVLVVSIFIGGGVVTVFYVLNEAIASNNQFIFTILMIVLNWLGSMIGYDKIIQTITQFKDKTNN